MADKEKKVAKTSDVETATTDESKAAAKVAKAAKGNANKKDKPNFFSRTGKGAKKFFKDFKGECKKIDWPDAQTILKSTGIVLLVVALVSVFVFALDFGLKEGIEGLKYLAVGEVETTTSADAAGDADEHDHDHDHADEEADKQEATEADKTTEAKEETSEAETTTAKAE